MASYLWAWWYGSNATTAGEETEPTSNIEEPYFSSVPAETPAPSPVAVSISTPEETQEAIEEAKDYNDDADDDIPPAFPSINSIQRSSTPKPARTARADEELMPPPALPPRLASSNKSSLSALENILATPPIFPPPTSNILRMPSMPRTSSNTLQLPPSTTRAPPAPSKKRGKVALAPGHSPLDWAALKASGEDLRGTMSLMRITPSQLKTHNKRDDAWSVFNGKVYNITPYLSYHPGGERELMRVAGRDGTKLFASTHAWVNVEFMLDECMVGFLVPEPSSAA